MDFNKLLKLLRSLVLIVGILLLASSIYLTTKAWPEKPAVDVKISWMVVDFAFLIAFVYFLTKAIPFRPHLSIRMKKFKKTLTPEEALIMEHWRSIRKKAFSGNPDQMRVAIIEADKLVDEVLGKIGFTGETTGDKINQILSDDLGWIRSPAMKANEYRNNVVHAPDFEITREDVKKAIHNYEVLLMELDIIDPAEL